MQQYILDLQKYVSNLRQQVATEEGLFIGDLALLTEGGHVVTCNPLTKLTLVEASQMSEEAQICFEAEYMSFLHDEVARLDRRLIHIREVSASLDDDGTGSSASRRSGSGLQCYEKRMSNVFPDSVTPRLRMS